MGKLAILGDPVHRAIECANSRAARRIRETLEASAPDGGPPVGSCSADEGAAGTVSSAGEREGRDSAAACVTDGCEQIAVATVEVEDGEWACYCGRCARTVAADYEDEIKWDDEASGCPHDPTCRTCPRAAEDDACLPEERAALEAGQPTAYSDHWGRTITVCKRVDHVWDEGDEGAVYCAHCTGYRCPPCGGSGRVGRRRCRLCGGWGVEMWLETEDRFVHPVNWAQALAAVAPETTIDASECPACGLQRGQRGHDLCEHEWHETNVGPFHDPPDTDGGERWRIRRTGARFITRAEGSTAWQTYQEADVRVVGPDTGWIEVVPATRLRAVEHRAAEAEQKRKKDGRAYEDLARRLRERAEEAEARARTESERAAELSRRNALNAADAHRFCVERAQARERAAEASAFTFFPDADPSQHHNAVTVERTNWGFGPTPDAKQWAVRWLGRCLNRDGEWEFEPLPSSRDDEFLARCRFDRDEAIGMARATLAHLDPSEGAE